MALDGVYNLAQKGLLFKVFTLIHFLYSQFIKMNSSFGLTIDSYCMTTALYVLILVILELLFDRRNNKIVKGICLSISALITRFLP
jgi:hypothetical protein